MDDEEQDTPESLEEFNKLKLDARLLHLDDS